MSYLEWTSLESTRVLDSYLEMHLEVSFCSISKSHFLIPECSIDLLLTDLFDSDHLNIVPNMISQPFRYIAQHNMVHPHLAAR